MNMRKNFDISAYLVVGPENTLGRPVADVIRAAVENGFTCLQIRFLRRVEFRQAKMN